MSDHRELIGGSIASHAIYCFAGWLTTRDATLVLGRAHNAAPMAEAVAEYLAGAGSDDGNRHHEAKAAAMTGPAPHAGLMAEPSTVSVRGEQVPIDDLVDKPTE